MSFATWFAVQLDSAFLRCFGARTLLHATGLAVLLSAASAPAALAQLNTDREDVYNIEAPPILVDELAPLASGDAVTPTDAFTASLPIELSLAAKGSRQSLSNTTPRPATGSSAWAGRFVDFRRSSGRARGE